MELFGDKPGVAAILVCDKESDDSPMFMLPGDKPKTLMTPVFRGKLKELKNREITFEVRVDFYDANEVLLKSRARRYALKPSKEHPFGYVCHAA
jgi:hypothetical protein